jgi:hypothetical protein
MLHETKKNQNQSVVSPVSGNGIIFSSEWLFCNERVTVLLQVDDVNESVVSPIPSK